MSSTNRGRDRNKDDFYETHPWCVDALFARTEIAQLLSIPYWLEPTAGKGAIIKALQQYGLKPDNWDAVELNENASLLSLADNVWFEDFIMWSYGCADPGVTIGNPPFSIAMPVIQKCLDITPVVIMLLRLAWLETEDRRTFHRQHPSDIYVLPNRASFTPDGKADSCAYAWFVWGLTEGNHWHILDTPDSYPRKRKKG